MARNFKIQFRKSNGNLHLNPHGILDGSSAWELINLIHCKYEGRGSVFVDTKGVTDIEPFASHILKSKLDDSTVPLNSLFFKGEKGREIAPSGCRVLTIKKQPPCKCKNKCVNCSCKGGGHDPERRGGEN